MAALELNVVFEIDWESQRVDFEPDGSLRDIYAHGATPEDWRALLLLARRADSNAKLSRAGTALSFDVPVEALFSEDARCLLELRLRGVAISCHFFVPDEIELSFSPRDVRSEAELRAVLELIAKLAAVTGLTCTLTPENAPDQPIFRCDPAEQRVRYVTSPHASGRR